MAPKYWIFVGVVVLGFLMSGGFAWLLPRGRRTPPGRWEWIFVLSFGPVIWAGIAALVLLDRPAWAPAPPGSGWLIPILFYLAAATLALAAGCAWLTARWRWKSAALGEPVLTADPFADVLSLRRMGGDPPRLRPSAEVPPNWRVHLMLIGMTALCLLLAAPAFGVLDPAAGGPGLAMLSGELRAIGPVFLVMGAAAGVMTVSRAVGDWWGVPVARYFVTADGLLAGGMMVRWGDADAVALGPAPGPDDGTELLAVTGFVLFKTCTVRLLVDPTALPTLRAVLTDAGVVLDAPPA